MRVYVLRFNVTSVILFHNWPPQLKELLNKISDLVFMKWVKSKILSFDL